MKKHILLAFAVITAGTLLADDVGRSVKREPDFKAKSDVVSMDNDGDRTLEIRLGPRLTKVGGQFQLQN